MAGWPRPSSAHIAPTFLSPSERIRTTISRVASLTCFSRIAARCACLSFATASLWAFVVRAGAAFVANKVDAAVTWEPWLSRGKKTDFGHLLVDSSTTPGLITDVIIVTKDYVAKHPKEVLEFVKTLK